MSTVQNQVQRLQARSSRELKEVLGEELESAYSRDVPDSLRNDFMIACYRRIEPNGDPFDRVRTHENYSPSWSEKKQLATALRMSLTERVEHPKQEGITSLTKKVLTELIVAIRLSKQGNELHENPSQKSKSDVKTPARERPTERRFENVLPADSISEYAVYRWIVQRRSHSDGEHGVYVLDCTPPVGEDEDSRMKALRREAHLKTMKCDKLTKLERAAQAVNNGERLYYVGYAADVPTRARQHMGGAASGGAKFTNMFTPQALVDVSWFETEGTARTREHQRAVELTEPGQSFGYSE